MAGARAANPNNNQPKANMAISKSFMECKGFNKSPLHFQKIHALVAQRLWADLSDRFKYIITRDVDHKSEEYQWFEKKVEVDALRLFEDPTWYGNAEYTFRIPKRQ